MTPTPGLDVEPFGKVFAVVEYGEDGHKYGIYHCGSPDQCAAWIADERRRRKDMAAWVGKNRTREPVQMTLDLVPPPPSSITPS